MIVVKVTESFDFLILFITITFKAGFCVTNIPIYEFLLPQNEF